MINWFNAYRVFTSKAYRVVLDILSGLACCMTVLVTDIIHRTLSDPNGQVYIESNSSINAPEYISLMVIAGVLAIIIIFADYFAFAGLAARNIGGMNYLRSSSYGAEMIDKAVIGDWIHNIIRTFIAIPLASIVTTSVENGKCTLLTIFTALAVWGVMLMAIGASNLICRRCVRTLNIMVIFTYVGASIFYAGAVVAGLFIGGIGMETLNPVFAIAATVVFVALSILLFMLGRKDMIKGYKSGFEDKVGEK